MVRAVIVFGGRASGYAVAEQYARTCVSFQNTRPHSQPDWARKTLLFLLKGNPEKSAPPGAYSCPISTKSFSMSPCLTWA